MKPPMEKLLDKLIDEGENGVATVQVVFHPGVAQMAGALKKGPVDGTFAFGCPVPEVGPDGQPTGDMVMVDQLFEASAVQRICKPMEESEILTPGTSIITPGGTH